MVAELVAIAALFLATLGEVLHVRRWRRVAPLAFGPARRPMAWAFAAPLLWVAAAGAMAWGMTTLLRLPPKTHRMTELPEGKHEHIVLVLDVSPSMRLEDAGVEHKAQRRKRAADVLYSFFSRVPIERYRVSVIATFSEAKPVVRDTRDLEVIRNILEDLPMWHAFPVGETKLFSGLEAAMQLAKPWNPRSTIVVLVSDGDTVPAIGMPRIPASVRDVLVVGVGDPKAGKFINGRMSRQDGRTLRQIATRLSGYYHDCNERHLPSDTISLLTHGGETAILERLSKREYALIALALGAFVLGFLPLALHWFGTTWRPGAWPGRS